MPTLAPYDGSWPAQAERLVQRLGHALGPRALRVDHIGSTSVPGLLAKDVLDLQVGVRDLADADEAAFVRALRDLGFPRSEGNVQDTVHDWAPDPAEWQKRFHGSADPGRVAHVHVRRVGSPGHEVALLFRDWLRSCPEEAGAYADLKRELAATRSSTTDYTAAKEPWVALALGRARAWAGKTQWST